MKTKSASVLAALLAAALVGLFAGDSSATCIEPPAGGSAPVWLPPTPGSTAWDPKLDDPRWSAGPITSFPNSPSDQDDAQYRVVTQDNQIYVSIQILNSPPAPNDAVYFGIQGANTNAYLFEIAPDTTDAPASGNMQGDPTFPIPNASAYVNYFTTVNPKTTPWAAAAPPAFLKNVATWTNSPGVRWAVTLQVDASTIAAGSVQMFFGARISSSTGTTIVLGSSALSTSGTTGAPIGDTLVGSLVNSGTPADSWLTFDPLACSVPTGRTGCHCDIARSAPLSRAALGAAGLGLAVLLARRRRA